YRDALVFEHACNAGSALVSFIIDTETAFGTLGLKCDPDHDDKPTDNGQRHDEYESVFSTRSGLHRGISLAGSWWGWDDCGWATWTACANCSMVVTDSREG